MLIPKRTKYRKQHRPVRRGMSKAEAPAEAAPAAETKE